MEGKGCLTSAKNKMNQIQIYVTACLTGIISQQWLQVFRVPETATVLMSGGIAFGDLNQEQILDFQVKSSINICDGFSVK